MCQRVNNFDTFFSVQNMKALGIAAEYNPFHNGHRYHIERASELSGADCVIAVMSGNFTQRGEPAACSKWERAKQATGAGCSGSGADAVFELPFVFACNRAEYFAKGSVDMLAKLGCDAISFGCEAEDPEELIAFARELIGRSSEIDVETEALMKEGVSRAKAYEQAVIKKLGSTTAKMLTTPNNILGIEYIKRIELWRKRGVLIEILPVRRKGSSYNGIEDMGGETGYAGASAIRQMAEAGHSISGYIPGDIEFENMAEMRARMFLILKALILRSTGEQLAGIYGIGEGLENRLIKEIIYAENLDDYIGRLVSKRYSAATVRRILTYILTGAEGAAMDAAADSEVHYARLLAAGSRGREFIRRFESDRLDIVTNVNRYIAEGASKTMLALDLRAADMYNVLRGSSIYETSDKVANPHII